MESTIEVATALGRILVGVILMLAGVAKMRNGSDAFQKAILGYDLVPAWMAPLLAQLLPAFEILVGAMLVLGLLINLATAAAFVLVLVFSGAIALSLLHGKQHGCSCFGFTSNMVERLQWRLVYRNLSLLALLVASVYVEPRLSFTSQLSFAHMPEMPPSAFAYALVASAVCAVGVHIYSRRVQNLVRQRAHG